MFSGADPAIVDAATEYGDTIGVAFQLSDDLLDIASDTAESGKTPGTDLREGVPTLPVLYALADDATDAGAVRLREILAPRADHRRRPGRARRWSCCASRPALKRARETVRGYAERARAQLTGLPDVPARHALESLADFIADRTGLSSRCYGCHRRATSSSPDVWSSERRQAVRGRSTRARVRWSDPWSSTRAIWSGR